MQINPDSILKFAVISRLVIKVFVESRLHHPGCANLSSDLKEAIATVQSRVTMGGCTFAVYCLTLFAQPPFYSTAQGCTDRTVVIKWSPIHGTDMPTRPLFTGFASLLQASVEPVDLHGA